ncbi:MAG: lipid A biosynthesis acyltransferase [Pseudomonadota bacterium]
MTPEPPRGTAVAAWGFRALAGATEASRRRKAALLARGLQLFARRGRRVADINIGVCFPSLDPEQRRALLAAHLDFTAALLVDVASAWHGPASAWREQVDGVHGSDCLSDQQPTLLLAPHLGNWELLNLYLGAEHGLTALFDPPRLAALREVIRRGRERSGSTLLPIGAAGLRTFARRLAAGQLVALLPDQVPAPDQGVYANFFDRPALTMTLAQRLVQRQQVRVVLGWARRLPAGRYALHFEDATAAVSASEPAASASAMNAAIESLIRRAPEQYQWSYRRFKRPPVGYSRLY